MQINGSTKLVAVFGDPITHTASPPMHNAAFAALAMNWVYLAFHVAPERLAAALEGVRELGLVGVNLTVPHKILAVDLMDEIDDEARRLGAVNTVTFRDGRRLGSNTDGYGLVRTLAESFDLPLAGQRVLVIGAGGAGRAIALKCGLERAAAVTIANRTRSKAESMAPEFAQLNVPFATVALEPDALATAMAAADVIVNASSVGLRPGDELPVTPACFSHRPVVLDTIYRPAETHFLRCAIAGGARAINGLGMLLHQGVRSFEIWTDRPAPVEAMRAALQDAVDGGLP